MAVTDLNTYRRLNLLTHSKTGDEREERSDHKNVEQEKVPEERRVVSDHVLVVHVPL